MKNSTVVNFLLRKNLNDLQKQIILYKKMNWIVKGHPYQIRHHREEDADDQKEAKMKLKPSLLKSTKPDHEKEN